MEKEKRALESSATTKIVAVHQDAEEKIASMKNQLQAELSDMQLKMEQRIREEKEHILSEKDALRLLSEKDLLIESLSALHSYALRFDRLEKRLSALSMNTNSSPKEIEEQEFSPCVGDITSDDLLSIVLQVSKRFSRITNITVSNTTVHGIVLSVHKSSTWAFAINFNDHGRITGRYTLTAENDDSSLPQNLAQEISKEIVYRLNSFSS